MTVAPLDRASLDATGLLSPSATGLPRSLWSASESDDVAYAIAAAPEDLTPTMRRLLVTLLLAEADAPQGSDGTVFLARVDKLLALGMLEQAGALLLKAGVEDPRLFRRWFDVTLLTGTEDRACRSLRQRPQISPTYPARIFCLARGGDWNAAALTLETGEALGLLTPEEDLLMARFLEPELVGDEPGPPPHRPSPLVFRIHEAIGEPVPTATLPLAFAHSDLRSNIGWKARIEAAERLARAGAIEPDRLLALYAERTPAASGPLWDRVGAVQGLIEAVASGRSEAISAALPPAWEASREAGLAAPFAEGFAAAVADGPLTEPAKKAARRVALLAGTENGRLGVKAARGMTENPLLVAEVVEGVGLSPESPLGVAIAAGLAGEAPPERLRPLFQEGRVGEALLAAIALFAKGAEGELVALTDALAALRALGFESEARQAAVELVLLEGDRL